MEVNTVTKEMNNWTSLYRYHIWPASFPTRESQGWNSHFYALKRGTPTSTVSTRTTRDLEEQSSLARRDTTTWLTSMGRSQGSITDTLFGPSVVPVGELRQSHTWTVTGTIWLQSWHQYRSTEIFRQINDNICRSEAKTICLWLHTSPDFIKIERTTCLSLQQHHDPRSCAG